MGCTSSSLKGDFKQADALARPSKAPSSSSTTQPVIPQSETLVASEQQPTVANETSGGETRKHSRFGPQSKRKPLTDEEMIRATGMTHEQLMAWGDKRIKYSASNPNNTAANWGTQAMVVNASMTTGFGGGYGGGFS